MRKIYGDNDEKILTVSRKSHANTPLRPSLYLDGGIQGVHREILTPYPTVHDNKTFWPIYP